MTNLENLVKELSTDKKYIHSLFGNATTGAFCDEGLTGNISRYPNIIQHNGLRYSKNLASKVSEKLKQPFEGLILTRCLGNVENHFFKEPAYTKADFFAKCKLPNGGNFKARAFGAHVPNGDYIFELAWLDNTHDDRPGSTVQYNLYIPKSSVARIVPSVKANPTILIDVFKEVFPNADNSKGTLKLEPGYKPQIEYNPNYKPESVKPKEAKLQKPKGFFERLFG